MPRNVKTLTLDEALSIVKDIIHHAKGDRGQPISVAVAGSNGVIIAFAAMDGVAPASVLVAQNKAYTAVMGGRDTIKWEEKPSGFDGRNFTDLRFTCFGGGIVLEDEEKNIIAGVGVSGRSSHEDHLLANLPDCIGHWRWK